MARQDDRKAFLVSSVVHLVIMMVVLNEPTRRKPPEEALLPRDASRRVFLPPAEVLRRLAPRGARPAPPRPTPPPPPAAPDRKSTMRVGNPDDELQRQLMLERDRDIGRAASRGQENATKPPNTAPVQPPPAPRTVEAPTAVDSQAEVRRDANDPLRFPAGPGSRSQRRDEPPAPGSQRSIASALRALEQQGLGDPAAPTGVRATGTQVGGLFFDPQGADFTAWTNHFTHEVYRNWIVPQPALLGVQGHVDIEFTVHRDGSVTGIRILKSAGTPAFDRAATNALASSRLMPLPNDFGPDQVTIQVTFIYNEGPGRS